MPQVNGYLVRLVKDPQLKKTSSGKNVCHFNVANDEGWGDRKTSEFFPCTAWEKTAETICNNLHKGDSVIIEGKWHNRPFLKNDRGYDVQNFSYTVERLMFLPKPKARLPEEDDDYAPYNELAGDSYSAEGESATDDFAPIANAGELDDLPF